MKGKRPQEGEGTLLEVGKGKRPEEGEGTLLEVGKGKQAGVGRYTSHRKVVEPS